MRSDLGGYALLAVYAAILVLPVAFVAASLYLAALARTEPAGATPLPPARTHARTVTVRGRPGRLGHGSEAASSAAPEVRRRQRRLGATALNLTYLAAALLTAAVVLRGLSEGRPPNGNMFEFSIAAAASISLVYSALARRRQWVWLAAPVTGATLLISMAAVLLWYTPPGRLMPALQSYWLGIHVSIAIIAVGFLTLGAALTTLHLLNQRPRVAAGLRRLVPAGADLETQAYTMHIVGFILWTFTLISGALWAEKAWGAYWQWDPKEVSTLVVWLIYAAHLHARLTAGRPTTRAGYLALAGFLALVLNFTAVNLSASFAGLHNYSGL